MEKKVENFPRKIVEVEKKLNKLEKLKLPRKIRMKTGKTLETWKGLKNETECKKKDTRTENLLPTVCLSHLRDGHGTASIPTVQKT